MSLVEMMVGLAVGLVISAALLLLFANASSQGQDVQRTSAQVENGRYATELLTEDLSLAGYFGETAVPSRHPDPSLSFYVNPNPCTTTPTGYFDLASGYLFPTPVRGYAASEVLGCLANRRAGTDAVAVRRLSVDTVAAAAVGGGNQQFYVQFSFCTADPPATPLVLSKTGADFGAGLRDLACAGPNRLRALVSRTYFVADCNECGSDTTPTLKRVDVVGNQLVETPLVEGVETFRLEYGFDTDLDGSADTYLTAPTASGETSFWENVMVLRVHMVVRSLDRASSAAGLATEQTFTLGGAGEVTTAADGYVRRAYSTTIRLVNPSSARESAT